jgi:hypothetical protein
LRNRKKKIHAESKHLSKTPRCWYIFRKSKANDDDMYMLKKKARQEANLSSYNLLFLEGSFDRMPGH